MNVAEFKQKMLSIPLSGVHSEEEFMKFVPGVLNIEYPGTTSVLAHLNYRCLVLPERYFEVLGVCLTVYTSPSNCQTIIIGATEINEIEVAIEHAAKVAHRKCQHDYARELTAEECKQHGVAHHGSCWHVYECSKCGEFLGFDSSG